MNLENLKSSFRHNVSFLDYHVFNYFIIKSVKAVNDNFKPVHLWKLSKLLIEHPQFLDQHSVIFNYSNRFLNDREKYFLSFGLDFKIPFFKPTFVEFFTYYEKLILNLCQTSITASLKIPEEEFNL